MQDVESAPKLDSAKANRSQSSQERPGPRPALSPSRTRRLGLIALVIAACAALAGGGYYAWQAWSAKEGTGKSVLTAVAARGDLEDTVTATGTLQPKEFVDVGTQVSGQLKKLHVDIGAVVKTGQLLAEIDPSVYQSKVDGDRAQLLNQRAQLADRQAQLALAELQLTRQQNLTRESATSADALQSAEAARQSALAQVNSIKAQMQQTESTLRGDEANLGYTKIYAPIAGTVVSQAAKQGQTLNANQQAPIVMRIADLSTMTVQAQVSEADVPKLRVGMDVYFTTLGGNNRRFYGKLRQIPPTPTVVNNVVLYDALFDVANPNQALMTQMTAQVFFVVSSAKDAVLVPLAALRPAASGGRSRGSRAAGERASGAGERASVIDPRTQFAKGVALVSVVDADGKITDREVKVGVMNRVSAQIVSGLEPGEKVVIGTRTPAPAARAQTGSSLVPNAAQRGIRP
ncbi:MAG: efflux RND transporter periplasmic adaptor subunit [Betaproteobacteria bacterium]|nr:efflux RND transporter periplasmic adaptor subunit [Betaproteobacteria bacterium]